MSSVFLNKNVSFTVLMANVSEYLCKNKQKSVSKVIQNKKLPKFKINYIFRFINNFSSSNKSI